MTLLWCSHFGHTLVAGNGNPYYCTINSTWERVQHLPDPPKFPELNGELPEPIPCSLHFLGGSDLLLAMYMDHGVIGCSAVSSNGKVLAVTNLYNGIDWYSLNSNHFMDASFQYTTHHTILDNVILPITFIHGNTAMLSGTSYGNAIVYHIPHATQAYTSQGDFQQIVMGVAERGGETEIWYWIQEPEGDTKRATELKSHMAQEPGQALPYQLKHSWQMLVPTIVIITCSIAILLAATQWDMITLFANWSENWTRAAEASETIHRLASLKVYS
ncbi:hypothetical protein EDB89DRAFT_1909190 [Lactarius sanguifluus]|nr:hypothetical protein EDB89DRAFT_1909190 [Lactarius sanguifluus]